MRAIIVCVDYADYLQHSLTYNQHHFEDVMIVTTPNDRSTQAAAALNYCQVHMTEAFYDGPAVFNKWLALEEGLSAFGREGWLCVMDADVFWPKHIPDLYLEIGKLYTPLRHDLVEIPKEIPPPESAWPDIKLHGNRGEWGGYTQIFHADDPHLPFPPWYQTNWRHAGGADSFFQFRWPGSHKVRPPFNVLHLGPHGRNWCGRATPYLNGTTPPEAASRWQKLKGFLRGRKRPVYQKGNFDHERY